MSANACKMCGSTRFDMRQGIAGQWWCVDEVACDDRGDEADRRDPDAERERREDLDAFHGGE